ncbi:hypothetical protein NQ317_002336 [Molorchus minor]|uniref:RNase H type-1 domain-containing protein n=1 Tax=Molorchus minor TaxID=1323400 RepID=A0ABQ9JVZ3_9CUCU|nr:hypothetical protein NQ317_002336 [Molorchus minor]
MKSQNFIYTKLGLYPVVNPDVLKHESGHLVTAAPSNCSYSKAAMQAICGPRPKSTLVQECGDSVKQLTRQKEVTLVWVPEHTGVPGNERADEMTW